MSNQGMPYIVAPPIDPSRSSSTIGGGGNGIGIGSGSGSGNEQQIRLQILASLFPPGCEWDIDLRVGNVVILTN